MRTNLLEESFKTFAVEGFGIVLNNKVIPVGSIGCISYLGEKIQVNWECPDGETEKTIISRDDFWCLLEKEYIVDISKIQTPDTDAKFKVGDLVLYLKEDYYIISNSHYDYVSKEWIYRMFKIGDDFKIESFEYYCEEEFLELGDKVEDTVEFKDRKYSVLIKEILGE